MVANSRLAIPARSRKRRILFRNMFGIFNFLKINRQQAGSYNGSADVLVGNCHQLPTGHRRSQKPILQYVGWGRFCAYTVMHLGEESIYMTPTAWAQTTCPPYGFIPSPAYGRRELFFKASLQLCQLVTISPLNATAKFFEHCWQRHFGLWMYIME